MTCSTSKQVEPKTQNGGVHQLPLRDSLVNTLNDIGLIVNVPVKLLVRSFNVVSSFKRPISVGIRPEPCVTMEQVQCVSEM